MSRSLPRYTREFVTEFGAKVAVKIEPENNQVVSLSEPELMFGVTLDPKSANQLGHSLIQAARIAAMNTLDPPHVREEARADS